MIPAVPVPEGAGIKKPIEVKLKPKWLLDERQNALVSESGGKFPLAGELPKKSRVVNKIPSLAEADPKTLSRDELELRRYLQVILPDEVSPADHLQAVQKWPGVEKAYLAPDVSLPEY